MVEEVLPEVPYAGVVFTIPKMLRRHFLWDRSLRRDHQLCSGVEFVAMLVPHVALRYESRIRCYAAISTTIRRTSWSSRKRRASSFWRRRPR